MSDAPPPTLYEWMGGAPALERLTTLFYAKVAEDALIGPLFAAMNREHPQHVARFMGEVFGGPREYSDQHGGHANMIEHHLNRHISNEQRKRWIHLLLESADELGVPDDPEFRSALVSYLEWGSRLAVINSQEGETVDTEAPMPRWGWGEVGGPYQK